MDVESKQWLGKVERGERWTRGDAEAALRAWQASGLPLATFAKRQGIVPQRLRWWQQRLGWAVEPVRPQPAGNEGAMTFVEVSWAPPAVGESRHVEAAHGDAGVEVVLPGGLRVSVRRCFDAETLRRVVAALEAMPC